VVWTGGLGGADELVGLDWAATINSFKGHDGAADRARKHGATRQARNEGGKQPGGKHRLVLRQPDMACCIRWKHGWRRRATEVAPESQRAAPGRPFCAVFRQRELMPPRIPRIGLVPLHGAPGRFVGSTAGTAPWPPQSIGRGRAAAIPASFQVLPQLSTGPEACEGSKDRQGTGCRSSWGRVGAKRDGKCGVAAGDV